MEGGNQLERERSADIEVGDFSVNDDLYLNNQAKKFRSPGEKTVAILAIIAIFAGLVAIYMSLSNISQPDWLNQAIKSVPNLNSDLTADAELRNTDTDGDGLSDYQELKIYGSSPYLSDTDSDGLSDLEEIEQGTDPNCSGNACAAVNSGQSAVPIQELGVVDSLTPEQLRQLLLQADMPQAVVDSFSDSELVEIYNRLLAGESVEEAINDSGEAPAVSSVDTVDDLKNLSGSQIRDLLIERGVPSAMISSIDDDQLKAMFINQIDSQLSNPAPAN